MNFYRTTISRLAKLNESTSDIEKVKEWCELYCFFANRVGSYLKENDFIDNNKLQAKLNSAKAEEILSLNDGVYIGEHFTFRVNNDSYKGGDFGITCFEIKNHKLVSVPAYIFSYKGSFRVDSHVSSEENIKDTDKVTFSKDGENGPKIKVLPLSACLFSIKEDINEYQSLKNDKANNEEIINLIEKCKDIYEKVDRDDYYLRYEGSSFEYSIRGFRPKETFLSAYGLNKKFGELESKNYKLYKNNKAKIEAIFKSTLSDYVSSIVEPNFKKECEAQKVSPVPSLSVTTFGLDIVTKIGKFDEKEFEKNLSSVDYSTSRYGGTAELYKMPAPEVLDYFKNLYSCYKVLSKASDWFPLIDYQNWLVENKNNLKKKLKEEFAKIDEKYPKK